MVRRDQVYSFVTHAHIRRFLLQPYISCVMITENDERIIRVPNFCPFVQDRLMSGNVIGKCIFFSAIIESVIGRPQVVTTIEYSSVTRSPHRHVTQIAYASYRSTSTYKINVQVLPTHAHLEQQREQTRLKIADQACAWQ